MSETGSVKFTAERSNALLAPFPALMDLNDCRSRLRQLGWLGVDANGIGFGNVSLRDGASPEFFITGSGSGGKAEFLVSDCAKVLEYDLARNWLRFEGTAVASSESLTHAAIYEAEKTIGGIIHCHSFELWTALLKKAPSTPPEIAYGTPEMAMAVQQLFRTTNIRDLQVFAMAGHNEGVISFGRDLGQAYAALMRATLR